MQNVQLEGRTAIITGAAGNIGSATAALMARRGARIVAVDVPGTDFTALRRMLPTGAQLLTISADVSSPVDVAAYVEAAVAAFGRIDALFNNAGILGPVAPVEDYDLEALRKIVDVNVIGVFLGMKYVLPVMYRQGSGSIINTSSIVGITGFARMSGYSMSKHAVVGLTRSAALEAAARNVRVNCINPGPIEGRMMDAVDTDCGTIETAQRKAFVPAHRYGRPEEVAALVAFLASDESGFCNGACYTVDGALSAA